MAVDERMWRVLQKHLNYNDEEFKSFRENIRNQDVLSKLSDIKDMMIILEVVESHGCNSRHLIGDKFYFDSVGNLLTNLCPKKICGYSLNAAMMMVFAANEMLYAGVNPNQIRFKRAGCFDVGLECGGWGRIVLELRLEENL